MKRLTALTLTAALARLEVGDLQADRADPRLLMPTSRKGRGQKRVDRRPVPLPLDLATRLQQLALGAALGRRC